MTMAPTYRPDFGPFGARPAARRPDALALMLPARLRRWWADRRDRRLQSDALLRLASLSGHLLEDVGQAGPAAACEPASDRPATDRPATDRPVPHVVFRFPPGFDIDPGT